MVRVNRPTVGAAFNAPFGGVKQSGTGMHQRAARADGDGLLHQHAHRVVRHVDLGLDGRRALVFGSTSGLGRAIATALVAEGARVAVVSRDQARADETARAIGAAAAIAGDLTVPGQGAGVVDRAAEALGGLDICVVNTGGGTPGPILATAGADDAAYNGRCCGRSWRSAVPRRPSVTAGGDGRLVYLTARSVVEASPDLALSSVFRSGVHAAARSLAIELAPAATVNVVVTGQFDTPSLARFEAAKASPRGCGRRGRAPPSPRRHPDGSPGPARRARRRRRVPVQRPGELRHRRRHPRRRRRCDAGLLTIRQAGLAAIGDTLRCDGSRSTRRGRCGCGRGQARRPGRRPGRRPPG